ncbi:hypothetical protein GCM10010469_63300 [Streptomyces labedae]|uniref:Uncharacterized protein n=1 Tax=Streptomyces labedae TaxID=285569 RepID=A0ABP6R699_9ACTN
MTTRLPLDEQLDVLRAALSRNDTLLEVLRRTETLGLPGWYVTAGCLFQTVWNVVTGRPPGEGIKDTTSSTSTTATCPGRPRTR